MSPQVRDRLQRIVAERRAELGTPDPRVSLPDNPRGSPPENSRENLPEPTPDGYPHESRLDEYSEPAPARALGGRFERRHVLVVAAVLLVGLLITGAWLIRAREVASVPVETIAPEPVATPEPPATPTPEPVVIRVHVLGAVGAPGVVTLAEGARVADAVEAAGGLTDDAHPGDLNFAAPVPDGAQIMVGGSANPGGEIRPAGPAAAPDTSPGDPGAADGLVNLNTATPEQLETLPGVGPVTATSIVAWRTENGPFTEVDQLREVSGIGPKTFEKLAPLVTV
ncbi:helix-hairpin-helix domain-containing protein [Enemella sp. A6]|uniref:helix-hairpin-helix domain-containing protein n=1 Tax=Enemella sp. A6 TaxID=3440152 RepID=UPI003EB6CC9D